MRECTTPTGRLTRIISIPQHGGQVKKIYIHRNGTLYERRPVREQHWWTYKWFTPAQNKVEDPQ